MTVFARQFSQACTRQSLIPERVKVEPVVRRETRIMLQPRDVALHPGLNLARAMLPIQNDLVGEMFEVNVVPISAAIQTEEQDDGAMHYSTKQNRAGWKRGRRAEEVTARCLVCAKDAIA